MLLSIVARVEKEKNLLKVEIYTKDGESVHGTRIHEERICYLKGMAISTTGRIAMT